MTAPSPISMRHGARPSTARAQPLASESGLRCLDELHDDCGKRRSSMRFIRSLSVLVLALIGACGGGRIFTTIDDTATDAGDAQADVGVAEAGVDACRPNPCLNGGSCTLDASAQAVCACPTGFTGPRCETNIDDCTPTPC